MSLRREIDSIKIVEIPYMASLRKDTAWMDAFLKDVQEVVEIGSGAGFSKEYVKVSKMILTDVQKHEWIDQEVDALNLPFADNSVPAFLCSHMIHHVAKPVEFIESISAKLRPGGLLLIVDVHTSLMLKALLYVMKHEGWSDEIDVFDRATVANRPDDPWSANCAIPRLLFNDRKKFESHLPNLEMIHYRLFESFMFPVSGGVISNVKLPDLPKPVVGLIAQLDSLLVNLMPSVFANGMQVVLRKKTQAS